MGSFAYAQDDTYIQDRTSLPSELMPRYIDRVRNEFDTGGTPDRNDNGFLTQKRYRAARGSKDDIRRSCESAPGGIAGPVPARRLLWHRSV